MVHSFLMGRPMGGYSKPDMGFCHILVGCAFLRVILIFFAEAQSIPPCQRLLNRPSLADFLSEKNQNHPQKDTLLYE
jgi:hypothetical protein